MTEKRNGCHNREPMRRVQFLHYVDSFQGKVYARVVKLPFRNSTDCQYTLSDLGQADKGCDGCKWRHRGAP